MPQIAAPPTDTSVQAAVTVSHLGELFSQYPPGEQTADFAAYVEDIDAYVVPSRL